MPPTEKTHTAEAKLYVTPLPKTLGFHCGSWGNNPAVDKLEFNWPGLPKTSTLHMEIRADRIEIAGPNFYVKGSEHRPECNAVTLIPGMPSADLRNSHAALLARNEEMGKQLEKVRAELERVMADIYDTLEGYADGAPDAPKISKDANHVIALVQSCLARSALALPPMEGRE